MNKELEKKLFDRFNFYRPKLSQQVSLMCFGFECGDGWFDIIWELSEKLEVLEKERQQQYTVDKQAKKLLEGEELTELNVFQVKEKFGELRFYVDNATSEMYDIIDEYENKSCEVCESCGKPGEQRSGGWIKTLCNDCYKVK